MVVVCLTIAIVDNVDHVAVVDVFILAARSHCVRTAAWSAYSAALAIWTCFDKGSQLRC